jgi:serine/threonine protein phosphatase 1
MNAPVKRFERNTKGRDYIVGDIHGCFSKLRNYLGLIGFNPDAGDRLFSVGDLVDRGPESDLVLEWLDLPWFHAVQGNHEDMAIRWPNGHMDSHIYSANGGSWNIMNPPDLQITIADNLSRLPIAIEIQTLLGKIGIVHAHCPFDDWDRFVSVLEDPTVSKNSLNSVVDSAMWSRSKIEQSDCTLVQGVRAVVVGHTPIEKVIVLGNTMHIDTGGWLPDHRGVGHFTILEAETLQPAVKVTL